MGPIRETIWYSPPGSGSIKYVWEARGVGGEDPRHITMEHRIARELDY